MNTKKKKSKIELAREIIANLRRGMNRQPGNQTNGNTLREVEPFTPMPMASQSRRPRLQTSHS